MKNTWTIRIITVTLISFGLAVLFAKISGEDKMTSYWQSAADSLTNSGKFVTVYTGENFAASALDEIDVTAKAMDVKIEKSKDDKVHFFYYKKNDAGKMDLTYVEGSVIKFQLEELIFPKNNLKINFNFKNMDYVGVKMQDVKESTVVIQAPANIKKIKITTVSGNIKLVDLNLDEAQIDSVSGDFETQKSDFEHISHTSVSGDIKLQGGIHTLTSKTVSGDLKFSSDTASPELKFSTISGDADLVFFKDPDVEIIFASTSGELNFWGGLPTTKIDGDVKGFKLGKGTAHMKFESTSGDVKISRKNND